MREKLQVRLDTMNHDLDNMVKYLSTFSEEQLNKKPQPDSWSALQVVNHLILAEKNSLAYCKKKLSFNPKLKKAGIASSVRATLAKFYLMSPLKRKAPKGVSAEFLPDHDTLDSVKEKWNKTRIDIKQFIDDLPSEYVDKEVYKGPFGGRLSIEGMLEFFKYHFLRHKKQIQKALSI